MSTPTPTLFDLALRDVLTARGITSTGMCRATGNHLASANDEAEPLFSESELLAADRNRNADKAKAIQARDEDALLEQVQRMRIEGAI